MFADRITPYTSLTRVKAIVIEVVPQVSDTLKVHNLVLMSPDIDADVATQKIEIFASDPSITSAWKKQRIPRYLLGRMTTYSSPEDRALRLSKFLFRSQERVGELTPEKLSPAAQTYFDKVGTA